MFHFLFPCRKIIVGRDYCKINVVNYWFYSPYATRNFNTLAKILGLLKKVLGDSFSNIKRDFLLLRQFFLNFLLLWFLVRWIDLRKATLSRRLVMANS